MHVGGIYVLAFFWQVQGDARIPDVHWGGDLPEAADWSAKRLRYLAATESSAHRLRPLICESRDSGGSIARGISLEGSPDVNAASLPAIGQVPLHAV